MLSNFFFAGEGNRFATNLYINHGFECQYKSQYLSSFRIFNDDDYDIKMDNSLETSRDRKHLRPINSPDEPPVYVIPDDWIRSELDAIDPLESAAETSHNESPDSDEDTKEEAIEQADEPHPEEPPPPDVRRSTRIANGKKSCHSCVGCKLIYNYLNVIDNFKVSAEKLPQILRWAVTY